MGGDRPMIGVALGGGVARGWSHIGVLKALDKAGFRPDIISGTSIGAVVGGCYAAGKLGELEAWVHDLTVRSIFKYLDFNFSGSGLLGGNKIHDLLADRLDNMGFEDLERQFIAVATEYGTGHEIWLKKGALVPAMRASYALPGIFRPVRIKGRYLLDGALVNPIPVSVCRVMGARLVIAVNLSCDYFGKNGITPHEEEIVSIEEDQENRQNGSTSYESHFALKLLQRQFSAVAQQQDCPGISEVMYDAFNITQDRIARARLAGDPPDFTVTPIMNGIGMFDFHRGEEAIQRGEQAANRVIDELNHVLEMISKNNG